MPSDNEIKQIMTEKVFPFFERNGLDNLLNRIANLEDAVFHQKEERPTEKEITEDLTKKMFAMVEKAIEKKMEIPKEKPFNEIKPDVKATVKIDNSGRAKVVKKTQKKGEK